MIITRGNFTLPENRIILALDGVSDKDARVISGRLDWILAGTKGNDRIDHDGAKALDHYGTGLKMADPKLFDIPATVRNRMLAYQGHATFVTVHGLNQEASLVAAATAANEIGVMAIAVTILTSITDEECQSLYGRPVAEMIPFLVLRAKTAGLHGIVCSPKEAGSVREIWADAIIITPGVRSITSDNDDQQRVDTPSNAILAGADFVVMGREILQRNDDSQEQQRYTGDVQADIGNVLFRLRMKSWD